MNKDYRLRDSKLAEWRSASGDRQNNEKNKQRVKQELRSAHGRAVKKKKTKAEQETAQPTAARFNNVTALICVMNPVF